MPLPDELRRALEVEVEPSADVVRAARELSNAYRAGQPTSIASPAHALAYVSTRMPATFAANRRALEQMAPRMHMQSVRSLLDLGGGAGSASWAAAAVFPNLEKVIVLDRNSELLSLGRRLARHSSHPALRAADWRLEAINPPSEQYDFVSISYVLGELSFKQIEKILCSTWNNARLALLALEPGTPAGFARILHARSLLLGQGANLVAPCPHHLACPLAQTGDWCHFAARLERSSLHRRAKRGELPYEDEKFSYVAFTRAAVELPLARIVRHPLKLSGHVKLSLCAAGGLEHPTVARSQKELYRAARQAEWGDEWR